MHAGHAADDRVVLHDDVARQHGRVGHDDVVAHEAVMRDMDGGHQQAVVADARLLALAGGPVNRRAFANPRTVADADVAFLSVGLQILRRLADGGEGKYSAVLADGRPTGDEHMGRDDGAVSDFHIGTDVSKCADLHILSDAGAGRNDRGLMDFRCILCSTHWTFCSSACIRCKPFPLPCFFYNRPQQANTGGRYRRKIRRLSQI